MGLTAQRRCRRFARPATDLSIIECNVSDSVVTSSAIFVKNHAKNSRNLPLNHKFNEIASSWRRDASNHVFSVCSHSKPNKERAQPFILIFCDKRRIKKTC